SGLVLVIWRGKGTARALALFVLAPILFQAGYITAYLTASFWTLPFPLFFEFTLLPFFTLFAAFTIGSLPKRLYSRLSPPSLYFWAAGRLAIGLHAPWQYVGRWMFLGAILCILLASKPFAVRPSDLYRPPSDTAITRQLYTASGIAPNAAFRGYTANLTGFK